MPNEYLNRREILETYPELRDLAPGQQRLMNHVGCTAGTDTKRRLSVRRVDGGLVMRCHHCGLGGFHRDRQVNHIRQRASVLYPVGNNEVSLPEDIVFDVGACHPRMNVWLGQYGITQAEREGYHIGWSPRVGRVILPITSRTGELVAYQARRVRPLDNGPKYLTVSRKNATPHFRASTHGSGRPLVLVEDILSAIIVGRYTNAIALLGTHGAADILPHLFECQPSDILIWLDDDNPAVRDAQRKLLRRVSAFIGARLVLGLGRDPKDCTHAEILEVLYGKPALAS